MQLLVTFIKLIKSQDLYVDKTYKDNAFFKVLNIQPMFKLNLRLHKIILAEHT